MTVSEKQSGFEPPGEEVLTLPEVAAFLRVPEEAVLGLVSDDRLPAQKIGGEWRFLKRAVSDWLRFGRDFPKYRPLPPPWMHPAWEDFFLTLEKRILSKLPEKEQAPKPGSKEAVLKHFGALKGSGDLEEDLAEYRAVRQVFGK